MVYRCPADDSMVRNQPAVARDRSYSLVSWLNCDVISGTILDGVNDSEGNLRKCSQIRDPTRTWVFIDEHQRSIDDGIFAIPRSEPDQRSTPTNSFDPSKFWDSFPGDRHSNGANLSFADGHVEHRRWRSHRVNFGPGIIVAKDAQDLADLRWLQERLPRTR
jgi:prepilin-type processing-associated H-X9-DG protein